ncbi:NYN domain-containing protein [Janibacter anophelis]|uniref:NYN domain-containing protein n=1 Tax=Janibacter anophelis TaxID=319054 RepID=UPI000DEF68B9|nr:NYN domain-containing protein [Janibacter anophelis]
MSLAPAPSSSVSKRALRERRMVLVDVENVAGGAVVSPQMAQWARRVVESVIEIGEHDLVVIGSGHIGLFDVHDSWPSARVRVRSGADGADLELLDVLTCEDLAARFDEVVLVSGDAIFVEAVTNLQRRGCRVVVAAWAQGLAARLRLAASETRLLDGWHGLGPQVGAA